MLHARKSTPSDGLMFGSCLASSATLETVWHSYVVGLVLEFVMALLAIDLMSASMKYSDTVLRLINRVFSSLSIDTSRVSTLSLIP